jgi:acetyl esterase
MRAGLAFGAATGGRIAAEGLSMDPMMSALVRFVRQRPPDAADIGKLRVSYAALLALAGLRADPTVKMTELTIPGLPPARGYAPSGRHRGTLLYFHGGGFIMGSPVLRDGICRRLAAGAGLRVISAGYRLAPEHPFPAAHDDAAAALGWVRRQGDGPLLVGGDSAGANLAAGLARDGEVVGQVLIYPVVDMVQSAGRYPSIDLFADGYLLTAAGMEACARALIPPGVDRDEARLSPIRADLSRAAPALIVVAGFDPLRDQGVAYAEALRAAGRPAELLEEPELVHGFADFAGVVPEARRAVDRMVRMVRAMAGV